MRRLYHVGVSGGKDSTALLLWMVYESGIPRDQMQATFCDTRNEADETYEHILMLSARVFPIQWLETEGFENLVIRKGTFPSAKRRFCTSELKLIPTKRHLENLLEEYDEVIPCTGIRRGESPERAKLAEWGSPLESYFGMREYRPLIDWEIEDVLTIHAKYKMPLNPLYYQGATRVGCYPCINSKKLEVRGIAENRPERIDKVRSLEERVVDKYGRTHSFFASNKVPPRFRSRAFTTKAGELIKVCTIDDVVEWSKTGKGAKRLAPDVEGLFLDELKMMEPQLCIAHYAACE